MQQATRSLVAVVVITGLITGASVPRVGLAQPATTPVANTTPGAAGAPAAGEDDKLYNCKQVKSGPISVSFSPRSSSRI